MTHIEIKHKAPTIADVFASLNTAARKTGSHNRNTGCAAMAAGLVLFTIATVAAIAAAAH